MSKLFTLNGMAQLTYGLTGYRIRQPCTLKRLYSIKEENNF